LPIVEASGGSASGLGVDDPEDAAEVGGDPIKGGLFQP